MSYITRTVWLMSVIGMWCVNIYGSQEKLDKRLIKKAKKRETFDITIDLLLKKKANPNAIDKDGVTAFYYVLSQDGPSVENEKLLFEAGIF
jgi:hypothetical protein